MPNFKTVSNTCRLCGHTWTDGPGQHAKHYSGCPDCGHLYWKMTGADDDK